MIKQLVKRQVIRFNIEVLTGIHIGGTKDIYGIGGVDSPVIKNPLTNQPIIPGSSLKGKMRTLLELSKTVGNNSKLFESGDEGPTRILFRDAKLSKASAEHLSDILGENIYTEIKAENKIDKFTGKTVSGGLRFLERVPAGAIFEGEIVINAYDTDKLDEMSRIIKEGFSLLEHNYLGGSGSRGYGKVNIHITEETEL